MIKSFICQHCGKSAPRNPRLKSEQHYCSDHDCQKARMRNWKHSKYATVRLTGRSAKSNEKAGERTVMQTSTKNNTENSILRTSAATEPNKRPVT